ncbi:MAG: hypothetical protein JRN68_01095 [Nitrososphaerota archaeon]|nr:hypothetical protein [Nitrososphaerota archaeon]
MCELLTTEMEDMATSFLRRVYSYGDYVGVPRRDRETGNESRISQVCNALWARRLLVRDVEDSEYLYYNLSDAGKKVVETIGPLPKSTEHKCEGLWYDHPETSAPPMCVTYKCAVKSCNAKFPTMKELREHYSSESYQDNGDFSFTEKSPEHASIRKAWFDVMEVYKYGRHPLANEHNDHFASWDGPYSQYRRYNRIGAPICQWCSMGIHEHGTEAHGGNDCKVLLIEGGQCNCWWGASRN